MTYNYLLPFKGALVSIGTVQTSLHLGKVASIHVEKNTRMSSEDLSRMISGVVDFGRNAFSSARDPYASAAFLFLGVKCRDGKDYSFLKPLLEEKEMTDDPVFHRKLRSSVCLHANEVGR